MHTSRSVDRVEVDAPLQASAENATNGWERMALHAIMSIAVSAKDPSEFARIVEIAAQGLWLTHNSEEPSKR